VAAKTGHPLVVTDVVPPLPGDTQALSSFFLLLGALIPSVAAGSGTALAFRKARPALAIAAPVAVAVAIGLVSAAIADGIAGLGNFAAIAGVTALFSLAVAAPTAVLARIKPPLVALAVLLFIVAGIPDSGGPANLTSFSAAGFRLFDSVLPLGVAASVTRNVVYFGGHSTALHLWVLAAWAAAGLAGLIVLTTRRRGVPAGTAAVVQPVVPVVDPAGAHAAPRHARPEPALAPGTPDFGGVEPITLVVGFDDSAPARRALTWGADLLRARLGALHVVYADHPLLDSDLSGFGRPEMDVARDDKAAAVAQAAAEIAATAGVPYTFERRQESPADAMLAAANELDGAEPASEPVLVTGRSHHAPHRILGSVPVELLHQSPYPVLTIS
jgi:nucleotide-binding universal stress UspA family protein